MNPTAFRWPRVLNEDRRCPYFGQAVAGGWASDPETLLWLRSRSKTDWPRKHDEDGYVREPRCRRLGLVGRVILPFCGGVLAAPRSYGNVAGSLADAMPRMRCSGCRATDCPYGAGPTNGSRARIQ